MNLNEAIKGMGVKSWERRENSSGKRKVYVRFSPAEVGDLPSMGV